MICLLAYLFWPTHGAENRSEAAAESGWALSGVANPFAKGQAVASQNALPSQTAAPIAQTFSLARTSLAGTQPDGDWTLDARGQLQPSRALRQRFDYYLSLVGEMPLADIRDQVLGSARSSLKDPAMGQVMDLWDRYVRLQQHDWKHAVDLRQPAGWSAALTERQIVRRQLLGADAAYAFYAEEERQLQQMLAQVQSGQSGPAQSSQAAPAPAPLPDASEREAAVQAQWQHWEQRVNAARERVGQLTQAPELSQPQRQQAIEAYLSSQFQGSELIRVRGLLGL
jgi:lipase chaperone LimK